MASVAFVTTEDDEAAPSPTKLPQYTVIFLRLEQVIGNAWSGS